MGMKEESGWDYEKDAEICKRRFYGMQTEDKLIYGRYVHGESTNGSVLQV